MCTIVNLLINICNICFYYHQPFQFKRCSYFLIFLLGGTLRILQQEYRAVKASIPNIKIHVPTLICQDVQINNIQSSKLWLFCIVITLFSLFFTLLSLLYLDLAVSRVDASLFSFTLLQVGGVEGRQKTVLMKMAPLQLVLSQPALKCGL